MVHWSSWKGTWLLKAVAKVSGVKVRCNITGPKHGVFDSEEAAIGAVFFQTKSWMATLLLFVRWSYGWSWYAGNAVLIIYDRWRPRICGPLTDGRFSGGTYGLVVGHIAPGGSGRWAQRYLHTGDMVTVDQDTKEITMHVSRRVSKTEGWNNLLPLIAVEFCKYRPYRFFSITWCRDRTSGIWNSLVKMCTVRTTGTKRESG